MLSESSAMQQNSASIAEMTANINSMANMTKKALNLYKSFGEMLKKLNGWSLEIYLKLYAFKLLPKNVEKVLLNKVFLWK